MLPNLQIPSYKLFGILAIEPFGVLVALAVVVGYLLARRRAFRSGLDGELIADALPWMILPGFFVAHWVSLLFYFPKQVLEHPLSLLFVWSGISSFGGFLGGTLGAVFFFRRHGVSVLKYSEALIFGFAPAWAIGRLGCTLVFDHPGTPTTFFLGMADRAGVVRHNLGLYEVLVALAISGVIYFFRNKTYFDGFFIAIVLMIYSPCRFVFDIARKNDATYWGWTPGQYFAIATFLVGMGIAWNGFHQRSRPAEAVDED